MSEEANQSADAPWTDINGATHSTPPGTMRSFGMNSREFHEAVSERPGPWRWGPGLPSQPKGDRSPVVPGVEWRDG